MDMSLLYIGQQFTIYVGFIFLFAGLFGNSMNIFIFSSVQTYQKTPCSFYFLIGSIFNNLYILINLTSRIISVGYGIDLTSISVIWCKARQFFIITLSVITFTCSCLAAIDQFLVISRNVYLRQCSNIKWAHRIIFILIIFWFLHEIPCLVFFDIIPIVKTCTFTNNTYNIYISIFVFVFLCAIPMIVMIGFGCLAYRNICQTMHLAEQHVDRQSIKMTLIQVILVIISNAPFGTFVAYGLITASVSKDINRQMKEYLAVTILSLLNYSYYVVCFIIVILLNIIFLNFLGEFLYVSNFIKSLSSNSKRSNILVAKNKSN